MAEEIANIAGTKIVPLSKLLMQDTTLQMSLIILVMGIVAIILVNRKISFLIDTKKFVYARPDAAEFVKKLCCRCLQLPLLFQFQDISRSLNYLIVKFQ